MDITKEQFETYERCRESGVTNMWDVKFVEYITGLDRKTIMAIMSNYRDLADKYGKKVA